MRKKKNNKQTEKGTRYISDGTKVKIKKEKKSQYFPSIDVFLVLCMDSSEQKLFLQSLKDIIHFCVVIHLVCMSHCTLANY